MRTLCRLYGQTLAVTITHFEINDSAISTDSDTTLIEMEEEVIFTLNL